MALVLVLVGGPIVEPKPFQATTMDTEHELILKLTVLADLASSYEPCSGLSFEGFYVEYSVMGMPRAQSVTLREPLNFNVPCAG